MIIYGSKATQLTAQAVAGPCKTCNTEGSVRLNVFQKYGHLFWIPFIPTGKIYATQCSHCMVVLKGDAVRNSYRAAYDDIQHQVKTPLWTFSGMALLLVLIGYAAFNSDRQTKDNKAWVGAPLKGDIYKYKTKSGNFTLLKVSGVVGDSVFISPSKYEATRYDGLTKLMDQGDSAFSDESYGLAKSSLAKMLDDADIRSVVRN